MVTVSVRRVQGRFLGGSVPQATPSRKKKRSLSSIEQRVLQADPAQSTTQNRSPRHLPRLPSALRTRAVVAEGVPCQEKVLCSVSPPGVVAFPGRRYSTPARAPAPGRRHGRAGRVPRRCAGGSPGSWASSGALSGELGWCPLTWACALRPAQAGSSPLCSARSFSRVLQVGNDSGPSLFHIHTCKASGLHESPCH